MCWKRKLLSVLWKDMGEGCGGRGTWILLPCLVPFWLQLWHWGSKQAKSWNKDENIMVTAAVSCSVPWCPGTLAGVLSAAVWHGACFDLSVKGRPHCIVYLYHVASSSLLSQQGGQCKECVQITATEARSHKRNKAGIVSQRKIRSSFWARKS